MNLILCLFCNHCIYGGYKMKIGMNLFLWTDCPVYEKHADIIRYIKKIGYDGVEFPVAFMTMEDIGKFRVLCEELGLERTAVCTMDPAVCDPISEDKSLREASLSCISEWCDKTLALGATLLSGPFFQGLGRNAGRRRTQEEWDMALDVLRRAFQIAADKGVTIALEPLNRFEMYFANTISDAKKFVIELGLPNVGILGDTMHGNIEEYHIEESYPGAMPYLKHIHISESTRGTPGAGHAIPDNFFQKLYEAGYDGYLTIEAFTGGTTPSMIPALHLWNDSEDSADVLCAKGYRFIRSHLDALH